jgi:hypothetical protein
MIDVNLIDNLEVIRTQLEVLKVQETFIRDAIELQMKKKKCSKDEVEATSGKKYSITYGKRNREGVDKALLIETLGAKANKFLTVSTYNCLEVREIKNTKVMDSKVIVKTNAKTITTKIKQKVK